MQPEFSNTVLHYLGVVLAIIGVLILIPVIPAILYGEYNAILPFVIASLISLIWGVILYKKFEKGELTLGRSMILAAVSFIAIAFIGMAPYFFFSYELFGELTVNSFVSSYFESMSGFTTTGLTVIPNIEAVPNSLLLWRALTQWIGGIGIIVLFLTILMGSGMSASYMYRGEGREDKLEPSIRRTARGMFKIYLLYTIIGAIVYFALGMPLFDSIAHVFTSVSTGGFSIKTANIGAYSNHLLELGVLAFMFIGSVSFMLHYKLLTGKIKELKGFLKSTELLAFLIVMLLFGAVFVFYLKGIGDAEALRNGAFHVLSASSTTGYTNSNVLYGDFSRIMLVVMMFVGGCAGSTAGGLKIIRFLILLKSIPWLVKKNLLPGTAVVPMKLGHRTFSEREIRQVSNYFFIYLFVVIVGALILTALNYSFIDSLFETTSAAATVGLSTGITSYALPIVGKIVLIFEMLVGRLEILPVLALIVGAFESKRWKNFYE